MHLGTTTCYLVPRSFWGVELHSVGSPVAAGSHGHHWRSQATFGGQCPHGLAKHEAGPLCNFRKEAPMG